VVAEVVDTTQLPLVVLVVLAAEVMAELLMGLW
jgi:hypothetical protein